MLGSRRIYITVALDIYITCLFSLYFHQYIKLNKAEDGFLPNDTVVLQALVLPFQINTIKVKYMSLIDKNY